MLSSIKCVTKLSGRAEVDGAEVDRAEVDGAETWQDLHIQERMRFIHQSNMPDL